MKRVVRRNVLLAVTLIGSLTVAFAILRPTPHHATIPKPDLSAVHPRVQSTLNAARTELKDDTGVAHTWGHYGMVLMAHEFHREAIDCFREAFRRDPLDFRWVYLTGVILEMSDLEAALQDYSTAEQLRPDYAPLHVRMGRLLMRLDELDEAEKHFTEAAQLDTRAPQPMVELGRVALARGEIAAARTFFQKAVAGSPWYREAFVELARVCFLQDDVDAAVRTQQQLSRLPATGGSMPDLVLNEMQAKEGLGRHSAEQADQLAARGNLAGAEQAFRALALDRPDLARPQLNLGNILQQQGRLREAAGVFREVVAKFPDESLAHFQLAWTLEGLNQPEEAAKHYQTCLSLKPDFAQAHYALGLLLQNRGDKQSAAKAFQAALQTDPQLAQAHLALGVLLAEQNEFAAAEHHMQCAVELAPADPLPKQYLRRMRVRRETAETGGPNDPQDAR